MKLKREDLYKALWKEPISSLASKWNVAPHQIRKAAIDWKIPRPNPGHWTKVVHGKTITPNLPVCEGQSIIELPDRISMRPLPSAVIDELEQFAKTQYLVDPKRDHWAVAATKVAIAATAPHHLDQIAHPHYTMPHINCLTTKATRARAFRLLNCILKCGEVINVQIVTGGKNANELKLRMNGEVFGFWIKEKIQRIDISKPDSHWLDPKYRFIPTGVLEFHFEPTYNEKCRWSWKDSKTRTLETVLPQIIANMPQVAAAHQSRKQKLAKQQQIWAEKRREFEKAEKKKNAQKEAFECLLKDAERWRRVKELRAFLDEVCVSMKENQTESFSGWYAWVTKEIDSLDPLPECEKLWTIKATAEEVKWSAAGLVWK